MLMQNFGATKKSIMVNSKMAYGKNGFCVPELTYPGGRESISLISLVERSVTPSTT